MRRGLSRAMLLAVVFASAVSLCGGAALAQAPAADKVLEAFSFVPSLKQSIQFRLQGGRLIADGPATGSTLQQKSSRSGATESRTITFAFDGPAISYEYNSAAGRMTFTTRRHTEFLVEREPAERSTVAPFKFSQSREGGVQLVVGAGENRRTLSGVSIWQLWLEEPELCRVHLLPLFVQLDPTWNLKEQADRIEAALVRAAATSEREDNERLAELVAELGDDSFAVRTAADRELRRAGREAIDYLLSLRPNELDAEQEERVLQIITAVSPQSENDSPERVASRLMDDPLVWLALLRRDDVNTRRAANARLRSLLDFGDFPVEGALEERAAAWETLAPRVRERVAEGTAR